jgi:rare lipoprotein A
MMSSYSPSVSRSVLRVCLLAAVLLATAGCSHKRKVASAPPPPPPIASGPVSRPHTPPPLIEATPAAHPSPAMRADEEFVATHRPIFTETGRASWYGPPYHNRRGADGRVYNEHGISAAHRTLPMGSLIRVTNIGTGQSAVMRVTDRGPFVAGRILDLSLGAAQEVGVWRPGTAEVRVDVYSTPRPMDEGGRWCVQIGALSHKGEALHLQERLERRYHTANVIEFEGPTGYWVRIRPANDDRRTAVAISKNLHPSEGEAWLVRLD